MEELSLNIQMQGGIKSLKRERKKEEKNGRFYQKKTLRFPYQFRLETYSLSTQCKCVYRSCRWQVPEDEENLGNRLVFCCVHIQCLVFLA